VGQESPADPRRQLRLIARLVASDLSLAVGLVLLRQPADPVRLVTPLHLVGWIALAAGVGGSVYLAIGLVRYSLERQRRGRE